MTALDQAIIEFINQLAQQSKTFDLLVGLVASNHLFKGVVVISCYWAIWFGVREATSRDAARASLAATVVAVILALGVNRLLATALPHQVRPINDPEIVFRLPEGMARGAFSSLSAFPSDHAVMFMGLALGTFAISWKVAAALLGHALIIVLLPRLYLGLHYPSDLVAGAVLGGVFVWLFHRPRLKANLGRRVQGWCNHHPASFYPAMFVATFLLATLFSAAVKVGYFLLKLVGHSGVL
jgi:undecaprenyl-diphosphatase